MARLLPGASVQVGERLETRRLATDDGQGHGQTEGGRPQHALGRAAHCDPHRQGKLHRARVNAASLDGGRVRALPAQLRALADLQQHGQFLAEEHVVVLQVIAEQGGRFRMGIEPFFSTVPHCHVSRSIAQEILNKL